MRLETHEGMLADPATPDAVAQAVAGLTAEGEAYVTAAELTDMLSDYLRGAADWSCGLTWHRVRVDFDATSASA